MLPPEKRMRACPRRSEETWVPRPPRVTRPSLRRAWRSTSRNPFGEVRARDEEEGKLVASSEQSNGSVICPRNKSKCRPSEQDASSVSSTTVNSMHRLSVHEWDPIVESTLSPPLLSTACRLTDDSVQSSGRFGRFRLVEPAPSIRHTHKHAQLHR
jgi:hypothetical protein